jgi:hypothetical protein
MGGCVGEKAPPSADTYIVLRVSAGASDNGYRSLQQALAAAEGLRRGDPSVRLKIEVAAGDYYIDTPLQIGADLSGTSTAPTVIAAAAENKPRLLSGRVLRLTWEPYRDGILRAHLADGPAFDRFFVDGKLQVRARYPNYDAAIPILNGYAPDALSPDRVQRWRDPAGAVVHAIHGHRWGGMQIPVIAKRADGTLVLGAAVGNNRPSAPHATYRYVENVLEELDAPGEWYYSAFDSTLYYLPPSGLDMSRAEFAASGPARIFDLQGTASAPLRFVRIEGFELQRTGYSFLQSSEPLLRSDWMIAREGAIYIEHAEDVTFTGNTLAQLGGNGVFVSGYSRRVTIAGNHIHHIGGSGISFTGRPGAVRSPHFQYEAFTSFDDLDLAPGPKTSEYPSESVAQDNLIHDIGTVEKQVAGVQISMALRIRVAHNSIYRTPRAGINIGDGTWGGHLIEHNDVFDTVLETGDHGAFNSWGRDRFWHPDRTVMEEWSRRHPGLWKLDVSEPIVLRNNRFRCDHGWDIDLDDGSSNYRIYDNVLLSGGLKMREGFDRRVWNNVLLNNGLHPHMGFEASGDRFERNIVMATHQPILMKHWDASIDFNLFPTRRALDRAQRLGLDRHSRYGNAQFEDSVRGDFRVQADSPAAALGFENFPMTEFGVTSEGLERLAAHAPLLTSINHRQ